jgi:hypothetical protein
MISLKPIAIASVAELTAMSLKDPLWNSGTAVQRRTPVFQSRTAAETITVNVKVVTVEGIESCQVLEVEVCPDCRESVHRKYG